MKSKVFEIFEQRCKDGVNQDSLLIIRILSLARKRFFFINMYVFAKTIHDIKALLNI
jgi:hypothetical protein